MRANVNILTAASESATQQSITGYENATAAHVAGDWGAHNQVLFYATPFAEFSTGHTIASGYLLRLMLTGTNVDGTGDAAFTCPAILSGISVDVGGAPVIIRQPASLGVFVGQIATFTVKAISADTMTYQWRKNGVDISGATSSTYVIGVAQTTDQASYDVTVTNSFGSVTSAAASLTVTTPSATFSVSESGGCFLPDTRITMANGAQKEIKDLRAGDRVASYQITGLDESKEDAWRTWQTPTLRVVASPATVKSAFKQRFNGYFQLLNLRVTYEHPLLTRRNGLWAFREVQDIKAGDMLWKSGMAIPVDRIVYVPGEVETWNLDVEETDVYLANGFMAHNNFFKSIWRYVAPIDPVVGTSPLVL